MDKPSKPFGPDRQREVYAGGMLADQTPDLPASPDELADLAREHLSPEAHAYVAGSAGSESTKDENRRAFDRWRIVSRMLRDVSERDLSVEILGRTLPVPVMLAPIGVQSIIHEEGELATARAAADLDVPLVLSSASSETMEDVTDELGDTLGWFQLYWSADRDVTASFLSRAEDAGYEAVVVTLDTPMMGWRERDVDHAYLPFLDGEGVANYLSDPAFRDALDSPPEEDMSSALWRFTETFEDPSLSWDDLDFLREHTDLPILLKGILHPDDAREAVERGVDGLVVSNHGGRQVDGAIGALDALPGVVDVVADDVPVLFDSGIRRGADAFRAIALGADAVLLGRPYVYGLAIAGRKGVREVLRNFLADLDLTLALSGHTSFEDVSRAILRESKE
ncbi:alpha-hydroxy-acid oxidizing protein [Haladaptatus sp. CMAA 1911]|uniref:alpha-hydroxy-acid oxidizing protein n=1 Tax=unclassified Haladaptatus TaxID=2622732 RepID=UPI003754CCF1